MRFMMLYKPSRESDAPPTQQEMAAVGQLIEEMARAGVLIATDGLQPSSKGARVRISGGKFSVIDGPFIETKELIAGYAIVRAKSKQEAIEWAKRFLKVVGEGESEIREMHEAPAFGPEATPGLRQKEARYVCLGYYDEKKWEEMSQSERNALVDECFAYDDVLRTNGHFAGGEALQTARNATTLRWKNGKVSITDGPYAETKEQLGGILVLEAKDLDHAVQLMLKHPGVKAGPFEIRPAEDLTGMIRESEQRRSRAK